MKFAIKAMAISTNGGLLSVPGTEVIDTDENVLFMGLTGPWEIEDRYLSFWNRLNDSWENEIRPEKIVVLSVAEVK